MGYPSFSRVVQLLTLGICFISFFGHARAATYYVRTGGNDASNGTSSATAFKTIQQAANMAIPGDTVYVGGGTYADPLQIIDAPDGVLQISFVADVAGARTGDAGPVTLTAGVVVYNSDMVALSGFTFSGTATRFLIWRDSYDGLLDGCTFTNGDEGLLIKEASLEMRNCSITGFAKDGIQVDGLTKMFIQNTTISGCGDAGLEIRKVAKIVMDTCVVQNNVGDGVEINVTTDVIDDGIVTSSDQVPLAMGTVKLEIKNDAQIYSFPSGATNKITSQAVAYGSAKVGLESGATLNGDLYYGPSGEFSQSKATVTGQIEQLTSSLSLTPIDPGNAATVNDNAGIPQTTNGATPVTGNKLTVNAGDSLNLPAGKYYFRELEINGTLNILGATVIYVTQQATFNQAPNVPSNVASDLKLYMTGGNFSAVQCGDFYAVVYGPNAILNLDETTFIGLLMGSQLIINESKVILDKGLDSLAQAWVVGTIPTKSSSTKPAYTVTDFSGGILDVSGSTFTGNANGLRMVTQQNFNSRFTDYSNNVSFGLELYGTCQIEDLTINSNAVGGISLNQTGMNDLTVARLTISDNTQYGVFADASYLAFDSTNIADWTISGSQIVLAVANSDISFQDVTISGGTTAAVQLTQCNMKAADAVFSGSGYGLAIDDSNVWLMSCTFSSNTVGLYANQNGFLSVLDSTFTANSLWGASVTSSGISGETATFSGCSFYSNAGGLSVVNAGDGDVLLRNATAIRDNLSAGLHFENCNLAVNDQAGGANWTLQRNVYGVSSHLSTLALTNVLIEDSKSYGMLCQDSSVSLAGCTLNGPYGIFTDALNNALTIDKTIMNSGVTAGWGIVRYGGDVTVKNSILDGYWLAVYLSTASVTDDVTLLNSTIANVGGYGVYLISGDALVRNTVVSGDGTGYGMIRLSGTLTHTHNVVAQFSTPYYGTTADSTESQTNVRFVDSANGDFHLGVGSPAINGGLDVGLLVPDDIEGNARPSFNGYEIGAYEYLNAGGSLRVLDWTETR